MQPVAIIGAGPAGLMAAEVAAKGGAPVTLYDRMPSAGRKLLLAGRGGLNLTCSEPLETFLTRYGPATARMQPIIARFPPPALRAWCEELGQPVFTGTSGRVFPQSFKTSPLLRAWLRRLDTLGVRFKMRHHWTGFDEEGRALFATPGGLVRAEVAALVLALGGASWPQLGADGGWTGNLVEAGIDVAPLQASNCGALVDWSPLFRDRFEGQPLKAVTLSLGAASSRGEAVVTRTGLEGGAIYSLSAPLREALARDGTARLSLALKPGLEAEAIATRLRRTAPKQSVSTMLRKALDLSPVAVGLLREAEAQGGLPLRLMSPDALARLVNAVPVRVTGTMPLARAISSAGGIGWSGLDDTLMLRAQAGMFAAGEMIDWDAPTGGYLLQACFATGYVAGQSALAWIKRGASSRG